MNKLRNFAFGLVAVAALLSAPATFSPAQSASAETATVLDIASIAGEVHSEGGAEIGK